MLNVFAVEGIVMLAASVALFAFKTWAFLDAISHRAEEFVAAEKMTKPAWTIILGVFLAVHMLFWGGGPLSLLNIIGTVAAVVYIVDVRPALRALFRR